MLERWKRLPTGGKVAVVLGVFVAVIAIGALLEGGEEDEAEAEIPEACQSLVEEDVLPADECAELLKNTEPVKANKQARSEKNDKPSEQEVEELVEEELTPELVVDTMIALNPGTLKKICPAYDALGDELAFEGFRSGYKSGPGEPGARAVFDEMIDRC